LGRCGVKDLYPGTPDFSFSSANAHALSSQRFHLEGNFLPEGNLGLWKEIWKEIAFGRKLGGNIVIRKEMRRKSILSHNF
jgi:hypothetical protein